MRRLVIFVFYMVVLELGACALNASNPAPVGEISISPNKAKSSNPTVSASTASTKPQSAAKSPDKDWRPDDYVVKKGDTLYSIGLEHGFDYREIAQQNQIEAPYTIKVGQTLKLKELKSSGKTKPAEKKPEENVVTKPLTGENVLPQAKVIEEPIVAKPIEDNPQATASPTPITSSPNSLTKETTDINDKLAAQSRPEPASNTSLTASSTNADWSWPAKGRVINPFSEGGNAKGIDIEGKLGQEITAAAGGKVIYNGGDLRGYGNMIIIKHDKDYLSVYAHNSKTLVKEGQVVNKGQKIAEMGNSGTDKVKLHFEIRFQGKSIDPAKFLGNAP